MATTTTTTRTTTTTEPSARCGTVEGESPPFTLLELYDAYQLCKKHKASKQSHLRFEQHLEENLIDLRDALNNKTWDISTATTFVAMHPKPREIWASQFKDRVVHHLLIAPLEKIYEHDDFPHSFLDCVYSCRKQKGTHKAVQHTRCYVKQYAYVLQLDIKQFFTSIDKQLLCDILDEELAATTFSRKEHIVGLLKKIVLHHYSQDCIRQQDNVEHITPEKSLFNTEKQGRGLPIGNLTSQFLANVYLGRLDRFIYNELKQSAYIRYVDDLLIFGDDKVLLYSLITKIDAFLQSNLKQSLQHKKTELKRTSQGIDYLGYFIKSTHTLVRKRVVAVAKSKMHKQLQKVKANPCRTNQKQLQQSMNAYFGHFRMAHARKLELSLAKRCVPYLIYKRNLGRYTMVLQTKNKSFHSSTEQYAFFKEEYNDSIIAFQNGTFFRFYGEQAQIMSEKLTLKLLRSKRGKYHCGFPVDSTKKLDALEKSGFSYVLVTQTDHELPTGIRERIVSKVVKGKSFIVKDFLQEQLSDVLGWNLAEMTPIEVMTRLDKIIVLEKMKQ
jgi:hypothetical protein